MPPHRSRQGAGPRRCANASLAPGAAVLLSIAIAGFGGAATAAEFNPAGLPSVDAVRIGQICRSVIRVEPNEEHYDRCVESLSASLKSRAGELRTERARQACLNQGDAVGSSTLAVCELQARNTPQALGQHVGSTSELTIQPSKSYFAVSPHVAFQRDQLACAELGFEPGSGEFDSCATGLEAALFAADNPDH